MIGSTQQVARILFEKLEPHAGPQGQDRLLDRHARAALDPPRARDRRGDRGVARVLEAAEHVPRPAAVAARPDGRLHTTINQAVASTGRLSTTNPNLQAIPIRTDLGREIRSAFVAEQGHR
jgi:DNA polymerase I-like protein with 3'-5' exonuclease and polymerase domains